MTPQWYSNLLHNNAARWGLTVQPGRPLIDDDTDPYPQPQIVEILHWQGPGHWRKATISIVTLNERWSYCLRYQETNEGVSFGPLRKFCEPYPNREHALTAAIEYLKNDRRASKELKIWLHSLRPEQLALFN